MSMTPLEVVETELKKNARHLMSAVEKSRDRFGDKWERDCNLIFGNAFFNENELRAATQGYVAFSNQGMRDQIAFQRSGQYRHSAFKDVADTVYFDAEYMFSKYLPGLLLSHLLWPHHYAQLSFYRDTVTKLSPETFTEIGVGTGIYSLFTLLQFPSVKGVGVDLSETSLKFATNLLSQGNLLERYETKHCDITKSNVLDECDLLLSIELLEHLEDPIQFLQAVRLHIGFGGNAFVTAAINAAHADHIYLYKSAHEVESQLKQSGLKIVDSLFECAYEPRSRNELVPAIAAFHVVAV